MDKQTANPSKFASLKRVVQWTLLIFGVIMIARYIYLHQNDFNVIKDIQYPPLILIGVVQLASFFLMSYRLLVIMKTMDFQISTGAWIRVFTTSRFINTFIPHMGNVYRAAVLKVQYGFSLPSYLASFLVFSYLDRLVLLLITFFSLWLLKPDQHLAGISMPLLFGIASLAWLALFALAFFENLLLRIPLLVKRMKHLDIVLKRIATSLRNSPLVLKFCSSGVLNFALSWLATWLAFYAVNIHLTLSQTILFNTLGIIIKIFPLTPGNIGTTEATFAWLSLELNLEVAPSIIAAAALNVVSYVVFFAAGIIAGGGHFLMRSSEIRADEH